MANTTDQAFLQSSPEVVGLERQRKLADLLTSGAFDQPQGQMISGRYVAPAWSQQLAPLVKGLVGQNMNKNLDEQQVKMAEALRGRKVANIQKFAELQKTNPGEAIQFALSSGEPELVAMAQEKLKGLTLAKGAVHIGTDLGGNQVKVEGNPDLPSSVEEYQYGQKDPRYIAYQKMMNESKANKFDFSNMLGKGNIGEISPMLKESKAGAYEAIDKAEAANKVLNALGSGKAITGPGANQRIALNQVGSMLGVTGTDDEKAVKSREIIQGLAQLTLAGRKGMKGQGAMDKMEGELANQVMSGKIDFTPTELAMLANGAKKSAKNQYKQHENMMESLRQDEPRSARYFEVPVNPDIFEPITAKATPGTSQTVNDALSIIRGTKPGAQ